MGYSLDTQVFDTTTITPMNKATSNIETYLSDCRGILTKLSNGETWRGGTSLQHLTKLTELCNKYQEMYHQFSLEFNKFVKNIESFANDMISRANIYGGASTLSFTRLNETESPAFSFDAGNVAGAAKGDRTIIMSEIESFMGKLENINKEYNKIPGLFADGYGVNKAVDLSDYGRDMSRDINDLSEIINGLGLFSSEAITTQLENIKNAGI